MKMNKLFITGALLLGSLSALGMGLNQSNTSGFEIGEAKATRDVLRAEGQEEQKPATSPFEDTKEDFVKPTPENLATNVSRTIVQKQRGRDDKTTIRFVSAVNAGLSWKNEANHKEGININDGGQFGFHISYTANGKTLNRNINVNNYYLSLTTPMRSFCNKELSSWNDKDQNGSIEDFALDVLHEPDMNTRGYDSFIILEVRNIPSAYVDMTIEAQPYFIPTDGTKKFAEVTKKADCTGTEYTTIQVGDSAPEKMLNKVLLPTEEEKGKARIVLDLAWDKVNTILFRDQTPVQYDMALGNYYVAVDPSQPLVFSFKQDQTQWWNMEDFTKTVEANKTYMISNVVWSGYKGDTHFKYDFVEIDSKILFKERETIKKLNANDKVTVYDSYGNILKEYVAESSGEYKVRNVNNLITILDTKAEGYVATIGTQTFKLKDNGNNQYYAELYNIKAGEEISFTLDGNPVEVESWSDNDVLAENNAITKDGKLQIHCDTKYAELFLDMGKKNGKNAVSITGYFKERADGVFMKGTMNKWTGDGGVELLRDDNNCYSCEYEFNVNDEFKITDGRGWTNNFGGNKLTNSDNAIQNGENIKITVAGVYKVTLTPDDKVIVKFIRNK